MKRYLSFALVLVMCLSLVSIPAFAAAALSIDKTSFGAGETIIVAYSGVTAEEEAAGAWITVAKVGAAASSYGDWEYVKQGSGTVEITAPNETGSYEVRFYQASAANDANLVAGASLVCTVDASLIIYPTKDDFDWSLIDFATGKHYFTGTYETSYRT